MKLFTKRRKNTLSKQRNKISWPTNKPFKILSLDGGGIRGIYGTTMLSLIEKHITCGEPIAKYFDMIAGTSTGGIMALGLGLKVPANTINNIYLIDGKEIFKKRWFWSGYLGTFLKLLHHVHSPLYNHQYLEKILKKEFGHNILGNSISRIIIPAFIAPKAEITVFKTDHHPDFKNDWKSPVWKVARATSAAPTYLTGHKQDDSIFLDGGIWANNPIMIAIVDALSAYDISREQIQILSIGTGNIPFELSLMQAVKGLWSWKNAIEASMSLNTDNATAQAGLLIGPQRILRLEPVDSAAKIALDDWENAVRVLPLIAAQDFKINKDLISEFFNLKVDLRHRFYTQENGD